MKKVERILTATNSQKVLDIFLDYPEKDFTRREVQDFVEVSKSGVNYSLRELSDANLIDRRKRGQFYLYSLDYDSPIIKQLKVLKNIIYIQPVVDRLKSSSSEIVLFGSSSRGEDVGSSDIDLFIVSNSSRKKIEEEVSRVKLNREVQVVVKSELKYLELKKEDYTFYEQVQRGIVLWMKE
jgi:predicted nucleotidyltransferase